MRMFCGFNVLTILIFYKIYIPFTKKISPFKKKCSDIAVKGKERNQNRTRGEVKERVKEVYLKEWGMID